LKLWTFTIAVQCKWNFGFGSNS